MASLPNLKVGDRVLIDGRDHEFLNFVPSVSAEPDTPDDIQFRDARNHRVAVFTATEFERLFLEGKLKWRSRGGRTVEEPPEEACDAGERCGGCVRCADRRLRANRQYLLRAFDANPVPKTDADLQAFLDREVPNLPFQGTRIPRGGTFRTMLRERGLPGDRRRRDMGDRSRHHSRKPRIDDEAQRVIWEKAKQYWTNITTSASDVHADAHTELVGINKERIASGLEPISIPGRTTVWRLLTQHCDFDHSRMRFGARKAHLTFRPLRGKLKVKRILDVAIMDHTPVDCVVVDDEQFVPVGRPYLTFCIDVRSRYPLGYVIGFTPPSVETVMACLRQVVRPKRDLKERYPDMHEWAAYGVPRTLLVDNGLEFTGGSFKDACDDAGISVEWAPVKAPEYKGPMERFFQTLNDLVIHKLAGAVPFKPHILKEYGIDPAANAVLLLSDLDELIYNAIVDVYGRDFHEGIRAVPEQVWRTDAAKHNIDYVHDLPALDRALGKLGPERTLSRKGVEWMGLTYCSEAVFGLLNELLPRAPKRGHAEGTVRVKFKYHPEDISKITVWNQERGWWVDVPCLDLPYTRALSEHAHRAIRQFAELNGLAFSTMDERCAARSQLNGRIRKLVNDRLLGSRRRSMRLVPRKVGERVGGSSATAAPDGPHTPIATTSNRVAGDQPDRMPARSRKSSQRSKSGSPGRPRADRTVTPHETAAATSGSDLFAGHDRLALINRARTKVGQ